MLAFRTRSLAKRMLGRLNYFVSGAATAVVFAFCGLFIAGVAGAAVSAVVSLVMFLLPAGFRARAPNGNPLPGTSGARALFSPHDVA
jgi:hypothetical protein